MSSTCPRCGSDAPVVYRGVVASCAVCGGARLPLSAPSVTLAGKPSKVGGAVAGVAGGLVLLFGLSSSLGLGLLLGAIFGSAVALAFALPLALVTLGIGLALVLSGRRLRRAGSNAERGTRERAVSALLARAGADGRGITAADAARALDVSTDEADAILTALAKREPDRVAVDFDEGGGVWYRAVGARRVRVGGAGEDRDAGGRVDEEADADPLGRRERR